MKAMASKTPPTILIMVWDDVSPTKLAFGVLTVRNTNRLA